MKKSIVAMSLCQKSCEGFDEESTNLGMHIQSNLRDPGSPARTVSGSQNYV